MLSFPGFAVDSRHTLAIARACQYQTQLRELNLAGNSAFGIRKHVMLACMHMNSSVLQVTPVPPSQNRSIAVQKPLIPSLHHASHSIFLAAASLA
jgi:hypothetical protein